MSKFKVGDRVAVYGNTGNKGPNFTYARGQRGVVEDIVSEDEEINVRLDEWTGDRIVGVHPKQCRKLKPKKQREIWVTIYEGNYACIHNNETQAKVEARAGALEVATRFVEAKPRRK